MAERERIGLDNLSPPRGSKSSAKRRGRGHDGVMVVLP